MATFSVSFVGASVVVSAADVVSSVVALASAAMKRRGSRCSLQVDLQWSLSIMRCLAGRVCELFVTDVITLVVQVQVDASSRFFVTAAQVIVQISGGAQHKEAPLPSGHSATQLMQVPADFPDRR